MSAPETLVLWRPVGQKELDLLEASNWRRFPPRLDWQPIFYPVLSREYAVQIARDWNTKDEASGFVGYVLRFEIDAEYARRFEAHRVGGRIHEELWVPAGELEVFNAHIIGSIEVVERFDAPAQP